MEAAQMPQERQKCTLGCPILDKALNGGIPCGSLTELVGENASAKTQLCLQLLLTVQLPVEEGGLNGSSLYIYTENHFPYGRLKQLSTFHSIAAREKCRRLSEAEKKGKQENVSDASAVAEPADKLPHVDNDGLNASVDPCMNVFVHSLQTADQLLVYLDRAEDTLSRPMKVPVRLLVVDSVAALFRADFDNQLPEMKLRSTLFFRIAARLKKLAEKFDLAVVVSNQVTDYFDPILGPGGHSAPGPSPVGSEVLLTSGRRIVPSLGISWSHCVNTRLFLSRTIYDGPNSVRRWLQVVFAPHLPNVSCAFVVDDNGVQGVKGESDGHGVKGVSTDEHEVNGVSTDEHRLQGGLSSHDNRARGIPCDENQARGIPCDENQASGILSDETGVKGALSAEQGVKGASSAEQGVRGDSSAEQGVKGASSAEQGMKGASSAEQGVKGASSAEQGVKGASSAEQGVKGASSAEQGVKGASSAEQGVKGSSSEDQVVKEGLVNGVTPAPCKRKFADVDSAQQIVCGDSVEDSE